MNRARPAFDPFRWARGWGVHDERTPRYPGDFTLDTAVRDEALEMILATELGTSGRSADVTGRTSDQLWERTAKTARARTISSPSARTEQSPNANRPVSRSTSACTSSHALSGPGRK
jgi:hypothetical protein